MEIQIHNCVFFSGLMLKIYPNKFLFCGCFQLCHISLVEHGIHFILKLRQSWGLIISGLTHRIDLSVF